MSQADPFEEYGKAYIGDKIDREAPCQIVTRIFSFDFTPQVHKLAIELSQYQWYVDNDILYKGYEWLTPHKQPPPNIKYISTEEEQESEFDWLLAELKQHYGWSDSDMEAVKPVILKKLKNKSFLEEMLRFVGADKSKFKEYNIDYEVEMDDSEVQQIDRWFE